MTSPAKAIQNTPVFWLSFTSPAPPSTFIMEEELASLRQQLREEQRRREEAEGRILEEQRRREDEQRRREEEQRRREEAEELARPLALEKYLEACHSLNHAIRVVTDRSLTTQGDTTNPTGRIFPGRIIPWDDFATKQEETWDRLSTGQSFASHSAFPSRHQLEYVRSLLKPISSEIGLRDFERDVVENAVQKLVDEAYRHPRLRTALSLQGTVTFESHTNLGLTDDPISAPMGHNVSFHLGGKTTSDGDDWKPDIKAVRAAIRFAMVGGHGPTGECVIPDEAYHGKTPSLLTEPNTHTSCQQQQAPLQLP